MKTWIEGTLTRAELDAFRRSWFRDLYEPETTSGLSMYNRNYKANFFTDAQLRAFDVRLMREWREEMDSLWEVERLLRLNEGDTEAEANKAADSTWDEARFRLLRSECRNEAIVDPDYAAAVSSTLVGVTVDLPGFLEIWNRDTRRDVSWVRQRSRVESSFPVLERM